MAKPPFDQEETPFEREQRAEHIVPLQPFGGGGGLAGPSVGRVPPLDIPLGSGETKPAFNSRFTPEQIQKGLATPAVQPSTANLIDYFRSKLSSTGQMPPPIVKGAPAGMQVQEGPEIGPNPNRFEAPNGGRLPTPAIPSSAPPNPDLSMTPFRPSQVQLQEGKNLPMVAEPGQRVLSGGGYPRTMSPSDPKDYVTPEQKLSNGARPDLTALTAALQRYQGK